MKYAIERTSQFKRDFKLAEKQGLNLVELEKVIRLLANGEVLPKEYKDHELHGKYKKYRECHIESDWLLIYKIDKNILVLSLVRMGTHSKLFKQ